MRINLCGSERIASKKEDCRGGRNVYKVCDPQHLDTKGEQIKYIKELIPPDILGGADGDRTHDLSIRPLSLLGCRLKDLQYPFFFQL
jgi:hypothetical protein